MIQSALVKKDNHWRAFSQGSNTVSKKWKQIVQAAMLMRWTRRHHSQLVGSPAGLVMRSLISRLCEKTKSKTLLSFSFQSSRSYFNADRACSLALWLLATHYFSGHACLHAWCPIVAGCTEICEWRVFWMWLLTHASRQKIYIFWHWPITLSFKRHTISLTEWMTFNWRLEWMANNMKAYDPPLTRKRLLSHTQSDCGYVICLCHEEEAVVLEWWWQDLLGWQNCTYLFILHSLWLLSFPQAWRPETQRQCF